MKGRIIRSILLFSLLSIVVLGLSPNVSSGTQETLVQTLSRYNVILSEPISPPKISEAEAWRIANADWGIDDWKKDPNVSIETRYTLYTDPQAGDQIMKQRPVWMIIARGLKLPRHYGLSSNNAVAIEEQPPKVFILILDAQTGDPLRAVAYW